MFVNIDEIYTYGRFYPDIERHVNWWFCITDYVIYDTETIVSNFGYTEKETIASTDTFIPLFKTNVVELEKSFLLTLSLSDSAPPFPYDDILAFDRNFKVYVENHLLLRDWYDFEKKHLCNDAIKWCKLHNIHFR